MGECFGVSVCQRGGRASPVLYKYRTVMDIEHEKKSVRILEDTRSKAFNRL